MKQEKWADALDHLNPDYITEAMPHKSAKRLKRGKERIMKQEFSIIKIATGIVASAAVIALVAGSAVLIHSMNNKPAIQPGASGSSGENSTVTETTASTDAAATTTLTSAAQPQKGGNFLGGAGSIVPAGVSGQAGSVIAHDDTYWYADGCRMTDGSSSSEQLTGEAKRRFDTLMSDGKQLYSVNANSLFTVDANGTESPFYTYEGYSHVVYSMILNLGNSMAPEFATDDPWYYIGGYAGNEGGAEGSYIADKFGVFYQPATGKQMNVEKLFDTTGETFYAPNEVRVCGNAVYALIGDGRTVSAIPHPDALMSDRAQIDWAQQYYALEVGGDGYVADWRVDYDTISYFCYGTYTGEPNCACRLWMQDGAFENQEIDFVPVGYEAENLMGTRVMYANGKLFTFSMIDGDISGEPEALIVTAYDANGIGDPVSETQLTPHENAIWAGQSGDDATIVCYFYRVNGNYCMETAWCTE